MSELGETLHHPRKMFITIRLHLIETKTNKNSRVCSNSRGFKHFFSPCSFELCATRLVNFVMFYVAQVCWTTLMTAGFSSMKRMSCARSNCGNTCLLSSNVGDQDCGSWCSECGNACDTVLVFSYFLFSASEVSVLGGILVR